MFRFFVSPCQFLTRLHFLTTVFFSQQPKQKKKSFVGGELDLAVLPSFAQSKRKNEDWFRGDGVCVWVCLRFACVSMCVGWLWFCLGGVVSVCRLCLLPLGHGLCVCVCFCLKRALSFGSLTLSRSRWPSNLLWSPPQFDYFYQKVLSLLCLFCFL